jgi:hypothetical protein
MTLEAWYVRLSRGIAPPLLSNVTETRLIHQVQPRRQLLIVRNIMVSWKNG